jgi:hypothetical protein
MTKTEAEKLANIIATADGGCSNCVDDMIDKFNSAQFGWHLIPRDEGYYGNGIYPAIKKGNTKKTPAP